MSLTDHRQEFRFDSFESFIVEMNDQISEDRSIIRQIEILQRLFVLFGTVRRLIFLNRTEVLLRRRRMALPLRHCTAGEYGEIGRCSSSKGSDSRYLRFSTEEKTSFFD